jgi:hypothetical protein
VVIIFPDSQFDNFSLFINIHTLNNTEYVLQWLAGAYENATSNFPRFRKEIKMIIFKMETIYILFSNNGFK